MKTSLKPSRKNSLSSPLALCSLLFTLAITTATSQNAGAWTMPNETLHYSVRFHWGFINANMGVGTLTTQVLPGEGLFQTTLSGKTIDIFGHYYAAGDTITGTLIQGQPTAPVTSQLKTEKGFFAIETITNDDSPGANSNGPIISRLPNGQVVRSRISDYGSGITLDLLSTFYYMRQLEYDSMDPGQATTIRLNGSHGGRDSLIITYQGKQAIEYEGSQVTTWYVQVTFTDETTGQSDSLQVWINTDDSRVPLVIHGSLSVGHLQCTLVGEQAL